MTPICVGALSPRPTKLEDLPIAVYEDALIKATIKLTGKIAVRLANEVPIIHATNRAMETSYIGQTHKIVNQLFFDEAKVELDPKTNKIKYRCMLVSNSSTPLAASTAVGLAVSSDKKVPVLRGEIRFPKINGRINDNVYVAEDVLVVIEVEPKVPPVARPNRQEVTNPDPALYRKASSTCLQYKHRNLGTYRQRCGPFNSYHYS